MMTNATNYYFKYIRHTLKSTKITFAFCIQLVKIKIEKRKEKKEIKLTYAKYIRNAF